MLHRLAIGRARDGTLTGATEVGDRFGDQPRLDVVKGHQLRRGPGRLAVLLPQRVRDRVMQLAAPALQQRIVRGVPHEGVAERVDGVGGDPAHRHDLGVDDAIEMAPEEIGVESGHGAEQGVGELPAHDRRHLRQLLRGPERVEPGHQRVVQRHGNIEVLPSLRVDDGPGELLGEQRDAVGALGEEIEERRRRGRRTLGRRVAARALGRDQGDDTAGLCRGQALQRQLEVVGTRAPRRLKFPPRRAENEQRDRRSLVGEDIQQLRCRRIHPLEVLEHEDDRLLAGRVGQPATQGGEESPARLGRCHEQRRVTIAGLQAEQLGDHRDVVPPPRSVEGVPEPAESIARIVGAAELLPEQVDDRRERSTLLVRRAMPFDPCVRLVAQALPEAVHEP